jgi:hypothetical protein
MAQTAAELLIEHGKAEGRQASILQLLRIRFQNVRETLTERITAIENLSHLDRLLEQAVTAQSLDEIQV